jgi:hypothetical protein
MCSIATTYSLLGRYERTSTPPPPLPPPSPAELASPHPKHELNDGMAESVELDAQFDDNIEREAV